MSTTTQLEDSSQIACGQDTEGSIKQTAIHEVGEIELIKKYTDSNFRASSAGPCITNVVQEKIWTQGVYNCVSVAILTKDGEGILFHAISSQSLHFMDEMLLKLHDKEREIQSILVAGGAEEGNRMFQKVYSELKSLCSDIQAVPTPYENTSVSVGVDPQIKRIEFSINKYVEPETQYTKLFL